MDIINYEKSNLPALLPDLAKFVLIGRDKLNMVRAGIKALDKLDVAEGVRKQKKEEAQMLAEALLDAEVRIGEILSQMPKASGAHWEQKRESKIDSAVDFTSTQTKQSAVKELGFDQKQVERFQTLAANKDLVEQVKQEARENDDLPTRTAVLQAVKVKQKDDQRAQFQNHVINLSKSNIINAPMNEKIELEPNTWYNIGRHWLYSGDNTNSDFKRNLPSCAFAFADPPYNAGVDHWDSDFIWQQDYLQDFADIVAVTPGISSVKDFLCNTSMNYRWSHSTHITNGMTRGALGFGNFILTFIFSTRKSIHRNSQDIFNIAISNPSNSGHYHKGKKPDAYMAKMIDLFTNANEIVIDPFLGSGTTLFVCETMGRICIGAERDFDYFKMIVNKYLSQCPEQNLQKLTPTLATLHI